MFTRGGPDVGAGDLRAPAGRRRAGQPAGALAVVLGCFSIAIGLLLLAAAVGAT